MPTLAINKKARHEYQVIDKFEAGIALTGAEVKSVRAERMNLTGAYVSIASGNAILVGAHIPRYPQAGKQPDYDPDRTRRLLLHQRELAKLAGKMEQKGLTLVPLSVYTKGPFIKLEIGLARGKQQFEKRDTLKKRDLDRDIRRHAKGA